MSQEIVSEFIFDRATKRTYRFQEVGGNPKIGTLYVQQSAFSAQPKKLRVKVEVME